MKADTSVSIINANGKYILWLTYTDVKSAEHNHKLKIQWFWKQFHWLEIIVVSRLFAYKVKT